MHDDKSSKSWKGGGGGHVINVKLGKVIHFNRDKLKVFYGEAEKLLYK